jgi:predicted metal-binding membrane protein
MTRWQVGGGGALRMGIEHGALCVGCCWLLMGLLFVGGVMNLLWVAAIALLVLAEKLVSFGETLGRIGGAGLIGAGLWLLA